MPLPGVEIGIALSAILLGAAIVFNVRRPLLVDNRVRRRRTGEGAWLCSSLLAMGASIMGPGPTRIWWLEYRPVL